MGAATSVTSSIKAPISNKESTLYSDSVNDGEEFESFMVLEELKDSDLVFERREEPSIFPWGVMETSRSAPAYNDPESGSVPLGAGLCGSVSQVVRYDGACFAIKVVNSDQGSSKALGEEKVLTRKLTRRQTKSIISDMSQPKDVKNEIRMLRRCHHPHIVRLSEVCYSWLGSSLVLELCTGGDLFKRLKAVGSFDEEETARVTFQMLSALAYLHDNGICHRDIKLANWLTRNKNGLDLVLVDFGLSADFDTDRPYSCFRSVVGTIGYMAPEVGESAYGVSVDMWSLGVVVYRLLTGKMPFNGKNSDEVTENVRSCTVEYKPKYWGRISVTGKVFVSSMLEKRSDHRITAVQGLESVWITRHTLPTASWNKAVLSQLVVGFLRYAKLKDVEKWLIRIAVQDGKCSDSKSARRVFNYLDSTKTGRISMAQVMHAFPRNNCPVSAIREMFRDVNSEELMIEWDDILVLRIVSSVQLTAEMITYATGVAKERLQRYDGPAMDITTKQEIEAQIEAVLKDHEVLP